MNPHKIKILHLIASPEIGGAEKLLLTFASHYDRKNFDVILGIFINRRLGTNPFWEEARKIDINLESINIKTPYDFGQILDIYRIIKRYKPQIIHTHGYKTNLLGFLMAKYFRISVVATLHGMYKAKENYNPLYLLGFKLLKYFDQIIAVSNQIRNDLVKKCIQPLKITILKNVPSDIGKENVSQGYSFQREVGIPSRSKIVGFVGRLEPVKGCAQLIEAFSKVVLNNTEYYLVIIGEGSERESLENQVKSLGLEKHVRFCGFMDNLKYVFKSLDIYVLPSLNEGIPLALLEAMAHGVPVIATRVGGVPEVVQDGKDGILVNPNEPEVLAESIIESLSNKEETARRATEAKKRIDSDYNIVNWIEKIQDIYLELVS